jgi:hypothetical protein
MLGWAVVMQLSLSHFCSSKNLLTSTPICNRNKTHWLIRAGLVASILWSFVGSLAKVSRQVCLTFSEKACHTAEKACHTAEKACHTAEKACHTAERYRDVHTLLRREIIFKNSF